MVTQMDELQALKTMVAQMVEHQIQADLRIKNQRIELRRLQTELESSYRMNSVNSSRLRDCHVYSDKDSAYAKIMTLESKIDTLERRIMTAKDYLAERESHSALALFESRPSYRKNIPDDAGEKAMEVIEEIRYRNWMRNTQRLGALAALDGKKPSAT